MSFLIAFGLFIFFIILDGLLAAAEVAIVSARATRLEQMLASRAGARAALAIVASPGRFLPGIQTGKTIASSLAAVLGGYAFVVATSDSLARLLPMIPADVSRTTAFLVVMFVVAFARRVFGELAPKRLALAHSETTARWLATPTVWVCQIVRPAVWLSETVTAVLVGIDRRSQKLAAAEADRTIAIDDIEQMLRAGARQGVLDAAEQAVARRALRLGDRSVREIMRPRIDIDALDIDTPADEVTGAVAMSGFSRLPIHEGDLDHIVGFVYTKDLLLRQHMGWPIELRKLVRPALLVPQSLRIDRLLERFREKRTQMAIVLDEFGGTKGLVTMEDVLEELVGEIHDEHRADRLRRITPRDDHSWQVDASLPLRDLLHHLDEELPSDLPLEVSTVGGLVQHILGKIPVAGDRGKWRALSFEVSAMDGRRVERVIVRRK